MTPKKNQSVCIHFQKYPPGKYELAFFRGRITTKHTLDSKNCVQNGVCNSLQCSDPGNVKVEANKCRKFPASRPHEDIIPTGKEPQDGKIRIG